MSEPTRQVGEELGACERASTSALESLYRPYSIYVTDGLRFCNVDSRLQSSSANDRVVSVVTAHEKSFLEKPHFKSGSLILCTKGFTTKGMYILTIVFIFDVRLEPGLRRLSVTATTHAWQPPVGGHAASLLILNRQVSRRSSGQAAQPSQPTPASTRDDPDTIHTANAPDHHSEHPLQYTEAGTPRTPPCCSTQHG